ncbi:MAG: AraC family transcriptional regulator, partial [Gemmatimonadota bacterium]
SDVLRAIRLDGAFFYPVEASDPWRVETVPAAELSPRILPHAEHLISYHFLTEGRCFGGLIGEEPVELAPGDVLVFPHGDAHVMSSAPGAQVGLGAHTITPDRFPHTVQLGPDVLRPTSFVCGFLGCDRRPFNPLLAALPRRMHLRGISHSGLGNFTRQLSEESSRGRAGADSVLTRLAELLFIEVIRRYLDELPAGQNGWLAGLRDEVVGRALALIHSKPCYAWTLERLARDVSSSRSSLAKRFTELVGQPPMQYLAQWRMQVAANNLAKTAAKVATIGADVGYESEAAFSRAFKKATGLAPGAWREARRVPQS